MDCSLPGSSVHGVLQARILAWVATSFFRVSSWPRDWTWVSLITGRFFTIWATREAPKCQVWSFFITAIDQQDFSHYFIAQEIIFSILWYPVSCNIPMENNLKKNRYVYICVYAKSLQMCPNLCDPLDSSPIMLLCPRDSPGKNTGVGVCVLLQGISWPRGQTHVSCDSCIAGKFFMAEPLGKPICIYMYSFVYLKLTQHCESTILQFTLKKFF